jgi:hypothetical protein
VKECHHHLMNYDKHLAISSLGVEVYLENHGQRASRPSSVKEFPRHRMNHVKLQVQFAFRLSSEEVLHNHLMNYEKHSLMSSLTGRFMSHDWRSPFKIRIVRPFPLFAAVRPDAVALLSSIRQNAHNAPSFFPVIDRNNRIRGAERRRISQSKSGNPQSEKKPSRSIFSEK